MVGFVGIAMRRYKDTLSLMMNGFKRDFLTGKIQPLGDNPIWDKLNKNKLKIEFNGKIIGTLENLFREKEK